MLKHCLVLGPTLLALASYVRCKLTLPAFAAACRPAAPCCCYVVHPTHTHTHTPFNGPLSGTTRVSRYQKGKPMWILLKQETVSGSGIRWAICKSAPRSRQTTTPEPHHSVFYRPYGLPAAQPTASMH